MLSDEHRRVLGHLSHPRSLASLVRVLDTDLGAPDLGIGSIDRIKGLLEEVIDRGLAKNVGDIQRAKDLHLVPNADDDVIDIPDEQAVLLQRRARNPVRRSQYLDPGDKYILTRDGLGLLTAPVEHQPPPLTGAALLAALEQNVNLAHEAVELELAAEGRSPEQIKSAEAVLARQQDARDEAKLTIIGEDDEDEDEV